MKKLLIFTAILLFGVGSVFAQWDVEVDWGLDPNSTCHQQLTSEYGYLISLQIYDSANDSIVSEPYNTEAWTSTSSTFDGSDTKVEDYCDGNHQFTPNFNVTVVVRIYHLSTQTELCMERDSDYFDCSDFENGNVDFYLYFD